MFVPVTLVVTFSARVVCSEIVDAVDDADSEMKPTRVTVTATPTTSYSGLYDD